MILLIYVLIERAVVPGETNNLREVVYYQTSLDGRLPSTISERTSLADGKAIAINRQIADLCASNVR